MWFEEGGGAFGNNEHWILESIESALVKFKTIPLDVRIVSYGRSNAELVKAMKNWQL